MKCEKYDVFRPLEQQDIESWAKTIAQRADELGIDVLWGRDQHDEYQAGDSNVTFRIRSGGSQCTCYWPPRPNKVDLLEVEAELARYARAEHEMTVNARLSMLLSEFATYGYRLDGNMKPTMDGGELTIVNPGYNHRVDFKLTPKDLTKMQHKVERCVATAWLHAYWRKYPSADVVIQGDVAIIDGVKHALRPQVLKKYLPDLL